MVLTVTRESDNTRSRHVVLTQADESNVQHVTGSDRPLITVDVNHHRLHEGNAFFIYENRLNGSQLLDNASIDIVIASASGVPMHMTIGAFCGGDAEFYLFEGTTATGGTSKVAKNRNRTSLKTSSTAALLDPTISVLGTELFAELLPGGVKKAAAGGGGEALEYILAPLTNYLIRVTNISGASQNATLTLEWYE
jgi:hypothetical protein